MRRSRRGCAVIDINAMLAHGDVLMARELGQMFEGGRYAVAAETAHETAPPAGWAAVWIFTPPTLPWYAAIMLYAVGRGTPVMIDAEFLLSIGIRSRRGQRG